MSRRGCSGEDDGGQKVERPPFDDPAIDERQPIQEYPERQRGRQLPEKMHCLRNRRRKHQRDRSISSRTRGYPETGKAVCADGQNDERRGLDHDESHPNPHQIHQRRDRHVASRRIRCGVEAGIPARFPRIKPASMVTVREEHVDEGVVGVAMCERQKSTMEKHAGRQRGEQEAQSVALVRRSRHLTSECVYSLHSSQSALRAACGRGRSSLHEPDSLHRACGKASSREA